MSIQRFYGRHKYGTILYGSDTPTEPVFGLSVDWERLGYFTGRNEAFRMDSFSIIRGRKKYVKRDGSGFEEEGEGKFVAVISDPAKEYSPYNVSGPLYGFIGPNRRMAMSVLLPDLTRQDLFAGTLADVNQMPGTINKSRFEGEDGWSLLRGQKANITVALQQNIFADEIIPIVLAKAGWPALWGTDLDNGVDEQPYWWVDQKSAAQAIFDLIFSELGRAFIKSNGALAFRNRYFIEDPIATITDEDVIFDSIEILNPWEVQRNTVEVVANPRTTHPTADLWTLPQVTPISAGQTMEFFPEFTFNNEVVPALNVLDPVAYTDYEANSAEDFTGTDLTADLVVTKEDLGNKAKLTIVMNGASNGFYTVKVRGDPVAVDASVPQRQSNIAENEDAQEFRLDLPWIQNVARTAGFAEFLLGFLSSQKKYVRLTLKPGIQNFLQYKLDLGRFVRVNLASKGIDQNFSISWLKHDFERQRNYTNTELLFEPVPDVSGYWQFGISQFGISTKFAI